MSTQIEINRQDSRLFREGVDSLQRHCDDVSRLVQAAVGASARPRQLSDLVTLLNGLKEFLMGLDFQTPAYLPEELRPIFRTVLQHHRRQRVQALERSRSLVVSPQLAAELEATLEPFERVIQSNAFRQIVPVRIPRLTDFITIQKALELEQAGPEPPAKYEDKFSILLAPSILPSIMEHWRRQCEQRAVPLSVVFFDIDNFKRFNTAYGELRVDRELLPVFMRTVDRFVFGQGRAVRHGGDECVLILPNTGADRAIVSVSRLMSDLSELRIAGIEGVVTISSGICTIEPDSFLTDAEALELAARAKKRAKGAGKNCVACWRDSRYSEDDVSVFDAKGQPMSNLHAA